MKNTKKLLVLAVAALLLVGVTVGGTMAWLQDATDPVQNTFTTAGIDITLTEANRGPFKLVPSAIYTKDPIVTVVRPTTDVDVYLFVKFEETGSPSTYLTYESTLTTANGWTQGDGTKIPLNVWYRTVPASEKTSSCEDTACTAGDPHWHLLKDDQIAVKDSVDTTNMATASQAKLTYTAYAIQTIKENSTFDVADAWAQIGK